MQFEVNLLATFYGVIRSVDNLVAILKAIHIAETSSCFIHEDGIVFTAEQSRAVKAIAYVKSNLFHVYNIKDNEIMSAFGLSIDALTDSFTSIMPAGNTPFEGKSSESIIKPEDESNYCEITYDGTGSLLGLRRTIKENNQFVQCTMIPFEPEEESEELKFDQLQDFPQRIVMPVRWFRDVLEQLETTTKVIEMTISPGETAFQLVGIGTDEIQDSYISSNSDLINNFSCDKKISYSYLYPHLMLCKKALALSYEVSVEMYDSGALRLIIKLIGSESVDNFIEFSFLPSTSFT